MTIMFLRISFHKFLTLLLWSIVFSTILLSCKDKKEDYHTVLDRIEAEESKGKSVLLKKNISGKKMVEVKEGGFEFLIPDRESQIQSFECSECHTVPLSERRTSNSKLIKAHWDIELNHATEATMNCFTCHNSQNLDELKSLTDHPIGFNDSFKLCAQCHSSQFEDWKGGAHGKQVLGWLPPRVSMTCVNCHNSHDPKIMHRWPSWFNSVRTLKKNNHD